MSFGKARHEEISADLPRTKERCDDRGDAHAAHAARRVDLEPPARMEEDEGHRPHEDSCGDRSQRRITPEVGLEKPGAS